MSNTTNDAEILPPARNAAERGDRSGHQTFDKGRVDPFTHKRHDRPAEDVKLRPVDESNAARLAREAEEQEKAAAEAAEGEGQNLHPPSNKVLRKQRSGSPRRNHEHGHEHEHKEVEGHKGEEGHKGWENHHGGKRHEDKDGEFGGPNASFNQQVGGPNDPGRLGEEKLIGRNDEFAASAGRARDMKMDGGGPYSGLKEESA